MAGPLPDQKRLFDLLQRAAEELKAAQKQATTAQAELDRERAEHKKTRATLEELETRATRALQQRATDPGGDRTNVLQAHPSRPVPNTTLPMGKPPPEEKTAIQPAGAEQAELRARDLADDLEQARGAAKVVRAELDEKNERLSELTFELGRLRDQLATDAGRAGELEAKLVSQDVELSSLREQLIVEQARGGDMRAKLHSLEDRVANAAETQESNDAQRMRADGLQTRVNELESLAMQAKTQLEAEHARATLGSQRLTQLESELAAIRVRRDELNVELAHVESDVKQARARVADLEGQVANAAAAETSRVEALSEEHRRALEAEATRRTEAETEKLKERDRHQATAHKLLEARARGRELEGAVDQAQVKVKELEAAVARKDEEHSKTVARHLDEHARASEEQRARVEDLQRQLEHATTEWRHVERTYEQLHREMLVLLDQRDEARRELDAIKQRFGLR